MKFPPLHIPLGYRRPIHDEAPRIVLTQTVTDLLHFRTECVSQFLVPETLPHLPDSDTLLRSHLASAMRDNDLCVEDYRALMRRALRRLNFLEWDPVNPDDQAAHLDESEAQTFEFSDGSNIWEGDQNEPDSWEKALYYRPQSLPGSR